MQAIIRDVFEGLGFGNEQAAFGNDSMHFGKFQKYALCS